MRLSELEPKFLKFIDETSYQRTDTSEGADGLLFLCPKCFKANHGPVGTHSVLCWSPHIPQSIYPSPGRWEMYGTGYDDLTLVAGSSSILLQGGCNAHFFIKNGEIVW